MAPAIDSICFRSSISADPSLHLEASSLSSAGEKVPWGYCWRGDVDVD